MSRKDQRKSLEVPHGPHLRLALGRFSGRSASARLRHAVIAGLRSHHPLRSWPPARHRCLNLQLEAALFAEIERLARAADLTPVDVVLSLAIPPSVELA